MAMKHLIPVLPLIALLSSCATAIEKPDYELLLKDDTKELRHYPDLPVVSTPMGGMEARNDSFGKLFRYISGNNEAEQKVEMTSPVFMEGSPKDEAPAKSGTMSFLIPSKVAKAGTPAPTGEEVALRQITGGTVATINFKGWRDEAKRELAIQKLVKWIASRGWKAKGEPFFAIYDPPWTPEILRTNEVWLRVEVPEPPKN